MYIYIDIINSTITVQHTKKCIKNMIVNVYSLLYIYLNFDFSRNVQWRAQRIKIIS